MPVEFQTKCKSGWDQWEVRFDPGIVHEPHGLWLAYLGLSSKTDRPVVRQLVGNYFMIGPLAEDEAEAISGVLAPACYDWITERLGHLFEKEK